MLMPLPKVAAAVPLKVVDESTSPPSSSLSLLVTLKSLGSKIFSEAAQLAGLIPTR